MSARQWAQVVCDNPTCDRTSKVVLGTTDDVEAASGWRSWSGVDLCPDCWDLALGGALIAFTFADGRTVVVAA